MVHVQILERKTQRVRTVMGSTEMSIDIELASSRPIGTRDQPTSHILYCRKLVKTSENTIKEVNKVE